MEDLSILVLDQMKNLIIISVLKSINTHTQPRLLSFTITSNQLSRTFILMEDQLKEELKLLLKEHGSNLYLNMV